jgi:hypothetical protein
MHPLYQTALDADAAFETACHKAGYKSRWHAPPAHAMPDAVRQAYDTKVKADQDWLAIVRGEKVNPIGN